MKNVTYDYFINAMVMNSRLEPMINRESKGCTIEEYFDDNNTKVVGEIHHMDTGDVNYMILEGL